MDKEKEYAETFKGLDEQFGSTFELEDNLKPKANVPVAVEEQKPFVQKQNTETELEDSVYISNELKMTVESIDTVMSKLDEDLKIGAPPRMFEVYAKLAESKIKALSEITSVSKAKLDAKMKYSQPQSGGPNITNNKNIILSSKDLLGYLEKENPKANTNLSVHLVDGELVEDATVIRRTKKEEKEISTTPKKNVGRPKKLPLKKKK